MIIFIEIFDMYKALLLGLFLIEFISVGQVQFDPLPPFPTSIQNVADFKGVYASSTDFADVDNDGDLDVLISGQISNSSNNVCLYLNDGFGSFSEVLGTPFIAIKEGDLKFEDFDGDNDQDILFIGVNNLGVGICRIYINDGLGNFSETIPSIDALRNSSIDFGDVDGDGDLDLVICGHSTSSPSSRVTKLYLNDGQGGFVEVIGTPFNGVAFGDVKLVDLDNDSDLDLLVFGNNNSLGGNYADQFENDGFGNFTLTTNSNLIPAANCKLSCADMDNDGDMDVLVVGTIVLSNFRVILYENDGTGILTESSSTFFDYAVDGDVDIADVDLDNDLDIVYTGRATQGSPIPRTLVYLNEGGNSFSKTICTEFLQLWNGTCDFADINGDGLPDLLVTGSSSSSIRNSKMYMNIGNGCFSHTRSNPFFGCFRSGTAVADIEGDGDQDILFTGYSNVGVKHTVLYRNDGTGVFIEDLNINLENISTGDAIFTDVDNDNDQDIIISGLNVFNLAVANLYLNDGLGNYTLSSNTAFEGTSNGAILSIDVDEDGDEDILITGSSNSNNYSAKLYLNQGNGNFTISSISGIAGMAYSSATKGDVDNDGDLDILLLGWSSFVEERTFLYLNNGNGSFTIASSQFMGVRSGDCEFSDIDNDGDLDIFIQGDNGSYEIARFYFNDGSGNFQLDALNSIVGVAGEAELFDFDNDQDNDLVVIGDGESRLYRNDGMGVFQESNGNQLIINGESLEQLDVDGDGDQDLLIVGNLTGYITGELFARLYENNSTNDVGLTEINGQHLFSVSPNPSSGIFDVLFTDMPIEPFDIFVSDLSGNILKNEIIQEGIKKVQLHLESLSPGSYLVSLSNDTCRSILRIVITK